MRPRAGAVTACLYPSPPCDRGEKGHRIPSTAIATTSTGFLDRLLDAQASPDSKRERESEARIPLEAELHEALTQHAELIPTADMGFGRCAVVGRETALASGYADLVLLDEGGKIALVEVKKEGNPDTRRVVAQLLDYAAAMWGQTVEEFELRVVAPHLGQPISIRSFLQASFLSEEPIAGNGEGDAAPFIDPIQAAVDALSDTLRRGAFTLVLAAPQIPPGVERVLDYLNAQGLRVFCVEYSYFADGTVTVLVPRLVVAPTAQQRTGPAVPPRLEFDRERFLAGIPAEVRSFLANLLDGATDRGAVLKLTPGGFLSIAVIWEGAGRSLCQVDAKHLWLGEISTKIPRQIIDEMHQELDVAMPSRAESARPRSDIST